MTAVKEISGASNYFTEQETLKLKQNDEIKQIT